MKHSEPIFVTGCAGFIGFHLSRRLLSEGYKVVGLDNLNNYYEVTLKQDRLSLLHNEPNFHLIQASLEDKEAIEHIFTTHRMNIVVNLAAQVGVRYSLQNPQAYVDSNMAGFMNILEGCRHHQVQHLIYASSSSVYGANKQMPFSTKHHVDHPISLYAATKKANELMAHTYSHLFQLPTTGLRFFTVYGPWGRPDMALFSFTRAMLAGEPIRVFNEGMMRRDFTYIDDIVEGMVRLIERGPAEPDPSWSAENPNPESSYAPYKIYNIGNNESVNLLDFIHTLEKHLGIKAHKELLPMQAGDVPETYADVEELMRDVGFKPSTSIDEGIGKFVKWYNNYYHRG